MSAEITEALLEMHYYRPFFDLFESYFGVKCFRILKPSQQQEALVGFDQGWVRTKVRTDQFLDQIAASISSRRTSIPSLYVGYFMQYKCPHIVQRRSRRMPNGFQPPYYKFDISLKPNKHTGISQHETLLRLQAIDNTDVSYACPMLLDEDALHEPPKLDDVRIVPIAAAPAGYASNESHFVAFRTTTDPNPLWCSTPTPGKALTPEEWLASDNVRLMEARGFHAWFSQLRNQFHQIVRYDLARGRPTLPRSLTIIEFRPEWDI